MNAEERQTWDEVMAIVQLFEAHGRQDNLRITPGRGDAILAVDAALRAAEARIANLEAALATHDRARLEAMRRAEAAEQRAADAEVDAENAEDARSALARALTAAEDCSAAWKRAAKKWYEMAAIRYELYLRGMDYKADAEARAEAAEAALAEMEKRWQGMARRAYSRTAMEYARMNNEPIRADWLEGIVAALDAARGGGEQELDDGCGMGGAVSG